MITTRPESHHNEKSYSKNSKLKESFYNEEIKKLQNWVKNTSQKIVVIMEGRDGAGKGGSIKALSEYLNPRGCRIIALQKPKNPSTQNMETQPNRFKIIATMG